MKFKLVKTLNSQNLNLASKTAALYKCSSHILPRPLLLYLVITLQRHYKKQPFLFREPDFTKTFKEALLYRDFVVKNVIVSRAVGNFVEIDYI